MLQSAAFLVWLGALASLFERAGWPWELSAHFRPQLALALAFFAGLALWQRRWIGALLQGVMLGAQIVSLVLARAEVSAPRGTAAAGPATTVCSFNVHTRNERFETVRDWLRTGHFDAVVLLEIDQAWLDALQPLRDLYPYQLAEPRPDNFGVAFLARTEPASGRIVHPGEAGLPSVDVRMTNSLRIIGTHPLPPGRGDMVDYRDEQLRQLAAMVRGSPRTLVVGDLNCAPWTSSFAKFARASGLGDTSRGWEPTWPAFWPLPLRTPIDHALLSTDLVCTARATGPDLGSDHLPLVVSVADRN